MKNKIRSIEELSKNTVLGSLTDNEIAFVVQKIKECTPGHDRDLPILINILGRTGARQYRDLVEKFLYYPSNEWVCADSLRTLCRYWGFTKDYVDEIKMFIKGAEWDQTDEIRMMAIDLAGEFLSKAYDKQLLQLLVDVFENLGNTNAIQEKRYYARSFLKSCAYEALACAMGKNFNEIPDGEAIEKLIEKGQLKSLDLTIIKKAHQIIQNDPQ